MKVYKQKLNQKTGLVKTMFRIEKMLQQKWDDYTIDPNSSQHEHDKETLLQIPTCPPCGMQLGPSERETLRDGGKNKARMSEISVKKDEINSRSAESCDSRLNLFLSPSSCIDSPCWQWGSASGSDSQPQRLWGVRACFLYMPVLLLCNGGTPIWRGSREA